MRGSAVTHSDGSSLEPDSDLAKQLRKCQGKIVGISWLVLHYVAVSDVFIIILIRFASLFPVFFIFISTLSEYAF